MTKTVLVYGSGISGCGAADALAKQGCRVLLVQIPYAYLDSYIDDYGHIRFRECYETEHGSRKCLAV